MLAAMLGNPPATDGPGVDGTPGRLTNRAMQQVGAHRQRSGNYGLNHGSSKDLADIISRRDVP